MKNLKKVLACILIGTFCLYPLTGARTLPSDYTQSDASLESTNAAIADAIIQDCNLDAENVTVVPMHPENVSSNLQRNSTLSVNNSSNTHEESMLQYSQSDGSTTTITTVVPYTMDEETGALVNSFVYASNNWTTLNKTSPHSLSLVDVTHNATAYYDFYYDVTGTHLGRPKKLTTSYSLKNSQTVVRAIEVEYITQGDLYSYPAVLTANPMTTARLVTNTSKTMKISQSTPSVGYTYTNSSGLSSSQVFHFRSSAESHGMYMNTTIVYTAPGSYATKTESEMFIVYYS